MDNHSSNSRTSSRYSKSVIFPRIKTDQRHQERRNSDENVRTDFGRGSSRKQRDEFTAHVLERLAFTENALEAERRGRGILEDHVRGLTSNLQRLSKDMAALQQQLKSGEGNAQSQSVALKNLEVHQVSGIGDVWNRLTLADLNTIKLSGDLNKLSGEVSDLKRSQENSASKLEKLGSDVEHLHRKVEKSNLEFEKSLHMVKVELDSNISKLGWNIENAGKRNERLDENYSRQEVEENYSQVLKKYEGRFDQFVGKHDSWKEGTEKRILSLEEDLSQVKETTSINYVELSRQMVDMKTKQKNALEKSHKAVKDSYREAFRAVYESITTMQTVLEAKLKMTEADLKTSINSIVRTISQ